MAVAAKAKPTKTAEAPVAGVYRCYHPHLRFPEKPCRKFLGEGEGTFGRQCPRCKRDCSFENPNWPPMR